MEITLSRATLRRILFTVMALIVGAGLVAEVLKSGLRVRGVRAWIPIFSLSYEQNIPTWYSSCLLLVCSMLLAVIAMGACKSKAAYVRHWWLLAAGFLYISLDETVSLHEAASGWMHLSGILYFSWVIPAGILVTILGISYLRFLAHLPKKTRLQFIVAGGIYVTGALVMELPLGYWTEQQGSQNFVYAAIDLVEESMEILGVTLFLLSLVEYMQTRTWTIGFSLGMAEAPAVAPAETLVEPASGSPPTERPLQ
jgi:hypothetical protein